MRTELDCDRPRGENAAHLLSVFHSDNTLSVLSVYQLCLQVFYSPVLQLRCLLRGLLLLRGEHGQLLLEVRPQEED